MMMFYKSRASPKHRYDIIEVDYGGGGGAPHTAKRSKGSIVVSPRGASLLVYKGEEEEERAGPYGAPWRSPTPTGSRTPSLPCWIRRRGKEEGERGRKGGRRPLSLSYSD